MWRLQAALALVGEVEIAVRGEVQVVQTMEVLEAGPGEIGLDLAADRIDDHDAMPMIGHEQAAVPVDLQAVRLAVILGDDRELAGRIDPQDAAVGDVDAVEVAVAIEGRTLQERLHRPAAMLGLQPLR